MLSLSIFKNAYIYNSETLSSKTLTCIHTHLYFHTYVWKSISISMFHVCMHIFCFLLIDAHMLCCLPICLPVYACIHPWIHLSCLIVWSYLTLSCPTLSWPILSYPTCILSNQIKSNQIQSTQIKSTQITSNLSIHVEYCNPQVSATTPSVTDQAASPSSVQSHIYASASMLRSAVSFCGASLMAQQTLGTAWLSWLSCADWLRLIDTW